MVHNTQNYGVFGLRPSSGVLKPIKQCFENWICFRPQLKGKTRTLLGLLERVNLKHWTTHVRVRVTLRLEVYRNQFVLATSPRDPRPVILFSNWTLAVTVLMLHPIWRKDGSVVYNCCWFSPAQSFWGPSLARLISTFYCLRFETPRTWRTISPSLYLPRTGWPSYIPSHWGQHMWVWALC
jgi:hypothetical protein